MIKQRFKLISPLRHKRSLIPKIVITPPTPEPKRKFFPTSSRSKSLHKRAQTPQQSTGGQLASHNDAKSSVVSNSHNAKKPNAKKTSKLTSSLKKSNLAQTSSSTNSTRTGSTRTRSTRTSSNGCMNTQSGTNNDCDNIDSHEGVRTVVLAKTKKGYGFVLRGARGKQINLVFDPYDARKPFIWTV